MLLINQGIVDAKTSTGAKAFGKFVHSPSSHSLTGYEGTRGGGKKQSKKVSKHGIGAEPVGQLSFRRGKTWQVFLYLFCFFVKYKAGTKDN